MSDYERSLFFRWAKWQMEARQDRIWWKLAIIWLSCAAVLIAVLAMLAFVVYAIGSDPRYTEGTSEPGAQRAGPIIVIFLVIAAVLAFVRHRRR